MGNKSGFKGMLADIFVYGISHKRPAVDVFHSRYYRKKFTLHMYSSEKNGAQ
jgi:hypothetical protein